MTIAATGFFAAMTSGVQVSTALPTSSNDFAAAVGTALAAETVEGPASAVLASPPVADAGLLPLQSGTLPPAGAATMLTAAKTPAVSTGPGLAMPAPVPDSTPQPVEVASGKLIGVESPPAAPETPSKARKPTGSGPSATPTAVADPTPNIAQAPVKPQAKPAPTSPQSHMPEENEAQAGQAQPADGADGEVSASGTAIPDLQVAQAEAPAPDAATTPMPVNALSQANLSPAAGAKTDDRPVHGARQPATSRRVSDVQTGHETAAPPVAQAPATGFAERLAARSDVGPAPTQGAAPSSFAAAVHSSSDRASAAPLSPTSTPDQATVTARPGQIGREMGVEIARRVSAGGDELTVRLNPAEMGRIEVRLSFDERGTLRATVAAESPAALDMLRRDSIDLTRTLTDAGVRTDAQSFRFDSRSGSGESGQFWQRQQQASGRNHSHGSAAAAAAIETPVYRPLRTSGRVDLMA